MTQNSRGTQAPWQAIGTGRWVWPLLVIAEIGNFLDWLTTTVGVGLLGLPERVPATRWMMAHYGVFRGLTMLKGSVAVALAGLAAGTVWWCGRREARAVHIAGLAWLLGIICVILAETVLSNVLVLSIALGGSAK